MIFGDNPAAWGSHGNANAIVAGDIVRADFTSAGLHTIFVYRVDGDKVYFTDCNFVGPCQVRWGETYTKAQIADKSSLTIWHASNNACTTGYPTFKYNIDGFDNTDDGIHLMGWVYNEENVTKSIQVHVYLDADITGASMSWNIPASVSRKDVDNAFHVGEFHGFDYTLTGIPAGGHTLYIYANDQYISKHMSMGFYHIHSPMTNGYAREIPDGDYAIVSAANQDKTTFYYMDIQGAKQPADNDTQVSLCGPTDGNLPSYEIWNIAYTNGFYRITQTGSAGRISLGVNTKSAMEGGDVRVFTTDAQSQAQRWAVSKSNGGIGYQLQAMSSSYALDLANANVSNGASIRQWGVNGSPAESWLFIPYQPEQPIEEGRYVVLYASNPFYELDLPGDTGNLDAGTNVELWNDGALSQFNSFDLIKLSNGYYKIRHVASGKCLDVTNGISDFGANVAVYDDNDSIAQQWAVIQNGDGYSLISRCNGYALNLSEDVAGNGKNVNVYPRLGNAAQRWNFIQAEYTVSYDASGGENPPDAQMKYYKTHLALAEGIPTRRGCVFKGWAANRAAAYPDYQPGEQYSQDKDIILYALWDRMEPDCVLPDSVETIEVEAFSGCVFQYVRLSEETMELGSKAFADCPNLTFIYIPSKCTRIADDAFSNVNGLTIIGQDDSYAETYAKLYGFDFAEQ